MYKKFRFLSGVIAIGVILGILLTACGSPANVQEPEAEQQAPVAEETSA